MYKTGVAHEPRITLANHLIGIVVLAGQNLGHTRVAPIIAGQIVRIQRLVDHGCVGTLSPRIHERGRNIAWSRPALDPGDAIVWGRPGHGVASEPTITFELSVASKPPDANFCTHRFEIELAEPGRHRSLRAVADRATINRVHRGEPAECASHERFVGGVDIS